MDPFHERSAESPEEHETSEIVFRYGYIGDLSRYRRAVADRYSDVGFGQRGRIVDTGSDLRILTPAVPIRAPYTRCLTVFQDIFITPIISYLVRYI